MAKGKKISQTGKAAAPSRAPSFSDSRGGQPPNPKASPRQAQPPPNPPRNTAGQARRKTQNKRRKARIYLAVSLFVILLSIVAAGTVFFKVEHFAIYGNSRYTAEEIIAASGVSYDSNLFLMDKFKIIDKMLEKMIFLESVEIRRVLPGTLKITVSEVTAAGAIETDGGFWLCDVSGRLLEYHSTLPPKAAHVVGAALDKPAAGRLLQTAEPEKQQPLLAVLPALAESGLAEGVTRISVERAYELTIWHKPDFTILLGKSESLPDKCRRLALLLPQLVAQGQTAASIDASGPEIHVLP